MKRIFLVCMLVFALMLGWTLVYAADFYVIPVKKCCTCKGTLVGTRWCDNGDGTVTDLTTCLVWLKKADWGGLKIWQHGDTYDDAHTRAGLLYAGAEGADLSDGSSVDQWRLPTASELYNLANGAEAVRSDSVRAFTDVQPWLYWSSSTDPTNVSNAATVDFVEGHIWYWPKQLGGPPTLSPCYVWPVRAGQ